MSRPNSTTWRRLIRGLLKQPMGRVHATMTHGKNAIPVVHVLPSVPSGTAFIEFWSSNSTKSAIHITWWFWGSTTKPLWLSHSVPVPHVLDTCPTSSRPCRQHGSLRHVLARAHVLGVSHHGQSPGCSSLSAKTQHSSFIAPGTLARARFIFTPVIDHRPCAPHLHTTSCHTPF
jgi:hypothetical protein